MFVVLPSEVRIQDGTVWFTEVLSLKVISLFPGDGLRFSYPLYTANTELRGLFHLQSAKVIKDISHFEWWPWPGVCKGASRTRGVPHKPTVYKDK